MRRAPLVLLSILPALIGGCSASPSPTAGGAGSVAADIADDAPDDAEPDTAEPGVLWRGATSRAEERTTLVARGAEEWAALWSRVGAPPPRPLPDDRMAAAVFLGPRRSAGFSVTIAPPVRRDDALVVPYRERVPGPEQAVAMMLTSPYAVRLVPLADGPVRFVRADPEAAALTSP